MRRPHRTARHGRWMLVLAALVLALSACSTASGTTAATSSGGNALDFSATTLTGATLDAQTLAGKPVALWFWAPWCTICRTEAPDVAKVAAEYHGKVTVLGVPGLGQLAAMKAFVSETATGGFAHVVDADGSLWSRFGIAAQPAFVFVDSTGATRTVNGSVNAADMRALFAQLT